MALPELFKIKKNRYIDADGKRCKKDTPGAIKKTETLSDWYAEILPIESLRERIERRKSGRPAPKRNRVKLCSDKRAAQEMLRALIDANERNAAGLVDYHTQSNQALGPILDEYQRHQLAKGNSANYVGITIARIMAVCDGCQFLRVVDLDAGRAANWLYEQRQAATKPTNTPSPRGTAKCYQAIAKAFGVDTRTVGYWRKQGAPILPRGQNSLTEIAKWRATYVDEKSTMGAGTSNHYVTALRGFGRWLVKHAKRAETNPFENLDKIDARGDVRKDRRVLSTVEFAALVAAANESPQSYRGLSGEDRAMMYTLAGYTGLRAGEVASLKTNSFDFQSATPTVTVEPAYTKNSELAVIPLRLDLAERLKSYLLNREPVTLSIKRRAETVWPGNWSENGAAMMRRDLEAAGIPYTDDGKDYDFHALRHQFITGLAEAGVHPKKAQALARHSKIDLTMDHYTKIGIVDAAADVERLGAIPSGRTDHAARAMGTDDHRAALVSATTNAGLGQQTRDQKSLGQQWGQQDLESRVISGDIGDGPKNVLPNRGTKKAPQNKRFTGLSKAPPVGLEPTTNGLTVRRSTN